VAVVGVGGELLEERAGAVEVIVRLWRPKEEREEFERVFVEERLRALRTRSLKGMVFALPL